MSLPTPLLTKGAMINRYIARNVPLYVTSTDEYCSEKIISEQFSKKIKTETLPKLDLCEWQCEKFPSIKSYSQSIQKLTLPIQIKIYFAAKR